MCPGDLLCCWGIRTYVTVLPGTCTSPVRGTPHLYLGPSGVQVQIGQPLRTVFHVLAEAVLRCCPSRSGSGNTLAQIFHFLSKTVLKVLLDPDLSTEKAEKLQNTLQREAVRARRHGLNRESAEQVP